MMKCGISCNPEEINKSRVTCYIPGFQRIWSEHLPWCLLCCLYRLHICPCRHICSLWNSCCSPVHLHMTSGTCWWTLKSRTFVTQYWLLTWQISKFIPLLATNILQNLTKMLMDKWASIHKMNFISNQVKNMSLNIDLNNNSSVLYHTVIIINFRSSEQKQEISQNFLFLFRTPKIYYYNGVI